MQTGKYQNLGDHPFIAAKPPITDQLTYLTLLEYNLNRENIGVLHNLLQEESRNDGTLVVDIGWDLVGLLLPFVDTLAARECLVDIARLGNPRECALKVEQGLRGIEWEVEEGGDGVSGDGREKQEESVHPAFRKANSELKHEAEDAEANSKKPEEPLALAKFKILIGMLGTLHSRIETKKPSRFVASTLSAVLYSISSAPASYQELCMDAGLALIERLKHAHKPTLPPRVGSSATHEDKQSGSGKAPDPEADAQTTQPEPIDAQIQKRLLQSFVTNLAKLWFASLDSDVLEGSAAGIPALGWSGRLQEQEQPRMIVPDRATKSKLFAETQTLKNRVEVSAKLAGVARGLGLTEEQLLESALKRRDDGDHVSNANEGDESTAAVEEDRPPSKPGDILLSHSGSILLYTTTHFAKHALHKSDLYRQHAPAASLPIFPQIQTLFTNLLGPPGDLLTSNSQPLALLDSLLYLTIHALAHNAIGIPAESDKDAFPRFLQTTSVISANAPNPSIRYCAHVATATVLRSHPEAGARLAFIRDTLANAPMETLRAESVGWLKGEILEENLGEHSHEDNIFTTPLSLHSLSAHLYPDLSDLGLLMTANEDVVGVFAEEVQPRMPFLMATLNFHFLLLSLPREVRDRLDVNGLHAEADVAGGVLRPLRKVIGEVEKETRRKEGERLEATRSDVMLLLQAIESVERRVVAVASEGS